MKKLAFTTVLLAILSFTLNPVNVEAGGNHKEMAKIAFRQSCSYNGPIRTSNPWPVAKCNPSGFVLRYNIIPQLRFNKYYSMKRIGAVGHVDVDCMGNVVNVTCY